MVKGDLPPNLSCKTIGAFLIKIIISNKTDKFYPKSKKEERKERKKKTYIRGMREINGKR